MKIVIFIAIFLLLIVAVCVIAYAVTKGGEATAKKVRSRKTKQWKVELEDRNTTTEAWLCQGDYKEFFGATDRMADGYSDRLIDLEMAAEDRARERNTARKVLNQ